MRLSARNQLAGTIAAIEEGAVTTIVKIDLGAGQHVTSSVTKEAAADLGLAVGAPVIAVIKSSDVILATD